MGEKRLGLWWGVAGRLGRLGGGWWPGGPGGPGSERWPALPAAHRVALGGLGASRSRGGLLRAVVV